MINREDMLELTRRMTIKRSSLSRVAGCYLDRDGEVDGSFNTHFLKLSAGDMERNLAIAKTIPFSDTNRQIKEYCFLKEQEGPGSIRQMLTALKECELKNDALMDLFYEQVAKVYVTDRDYAILMFYGCYDVPVKTSDKESQWESEEVYKYVICAICPTSGDYEPGLPEWGFLFPAFSDRSGDVHKIDIFQAEPGQGQEALRKLILG